MNLLWLLAIPLFAWADRTVGGAGSRSTAFIVVAIISLLVGHFVSVGAGVLGIAWIGYRSMRWWGTITPQNIFQIMLSLMHGLLLAVVAGSCYVAGVGPGLATYTMVLYALGATALAVLYSAIIDYMIAHNLPENGQVNAKIEIARGATFGAMLALAFML